MKWSRASARASSRQSRAAQRRSILNPLDKFSIDGHMSEAPERWLEKLHAPQHRECREILKNSSLPCADITPESGTRAVDEQCRKKGPFQSLAGQKFCATARGRAQLNP